MSWPPGCCFPEKTSARELPAGLTAAAADCSAKTMPCKQSVCHKSQSPSAYARRGAWRRSPHRCCGAKRSLSQRTFRSIIKTYGNALRAMRSCHELPAGRRLLVRGVAPGADAGDYGRFDGSSWLLLARMPIERARAAGSGATGSRVIPRPRTGRRILAP